MWIIFDVKMDFRRKARLVAGGHVTDPPTDDTYSSVASRESVRLGFLLASLNNLDLVSVDIGNAYVNADCREKVYAIAGPEFEEFEGRTVIIAKALYGLTVADTIKGTYFPVIKLSIYALIVLLESLLRYFGDLRPLFRYLYKALNMHK
jgi:hypothetical protein